MLPCGFPLFLPKRPSSAVRASGRPCHHKNRRICRYDGTASSYGTWGTRRWRAAPVSSLHGGYVCEPWKFFPSEEPCSHLLIHLIHDIVTYVTPGQHRSERAAAAMPQKDADQSVPSGMYRDLPHQDTVHIPGSPVCKETASEDA